MRCPELEGGMMLKKFCGLMLLLIVMLAGSTTLAQQVAQEGKATLQERAQKAGGRLVWRYRPDQSVTYANVEELAKRSDLIVVGRAVGRRARLRPDGKFIHEEFAVRVYDVIKGDIPTRASLTIRIPGGSYRFADKTFAVVIPMNFRKPANLGIYAFFLKKKGPDAKTYDLVSESQGIFDLTSGKVQPADLVEDHPVVTKYRDMGTAAFIKEMRKAVPSSRVK
jgi:hypothetical protein